MKGASARKSGEIGFGSVTGANNTIRVIQPLEFFTQRRGKKVFGIPRGGATPKVENHKSDPVDIVGRLRPVGESNR